MCASAISYARIKNFSLEHMIIKQEQLKVVLNILKPHHVTIDQNSMVVLKKKSLS